MCTSVCLVACLSSIEGTAQSGHTRLGGWHPPSPVGPRPSQAEEGWLLPPALQLAQSFTWSWSFSLSWAGLVILPVLGWAGPSPCPGLACSVGLAAPGVLLRTDRLPVQCGSRQQAGLAGRMLWAWPEGAGSPHTGKHERCSRRGSSGSLALGMRALAWPQQECCEVSGDVARCWLLLPCHPLEPLAQSTHTNKHTHTALNTGQCVCVHVCMCVCC